jgi:hypothetical protein
VDELSGPVEDDRLTTHWIQYTERLKPGYSEDRYNAWREAWILRLPGQLPNWELVGPDNIGGRITCLVATETSKRLLAGAACGGLWILGGDQKDPGNVRPDDKKWMSLDDLEVGRDIKQQETVRKMHNIGALAVDPDNPVFVYCGTGHAYHAGDSFPGVGLFQSKDGGKNWELLADAENQIPARISSIAVEPAARARAAPVCIIFGAASAGRIYTAIISS